MAQQIHSLPADLREQGGKGPAREARRQGRVPAVIYGDKQPPLMIAIEERLAVREVGKEGFLAHLYDIEVKGKKHRVLPRDVQYDPLSDRPIHIDFLRVSGNTRVRVSVPIHFANHDKAPGIKRGGMLNIVSHELEITAQPDQIPESITIDLTGLEIGASIHLKAAKLPAGVKTTIADDDFTIATIAPPTTEKVVEAAPVADAAAAPAAGAAAAAAAPAAAGGKAAAPAAAATKAPAGKK